MKIPTKLKKALVKDRFSNCAYVYKDGIVLNERTEALVNGLRFDTEVIHILPFGKENVQFRIAGQDYTGTREFKGRYVFHNPTLLADGIARLEIYMNNGSENTKSKGVHIDTVTLTTESGMKICEHIMDGFLSSDIAYQNADAPRSIMDWDTWDYRGRIVWHGEKPVVEEVTA